MLPPAYDCHQRMLMGSSSLPSLPPPPPLPQQSIEYLSNRKNEQKNLTNERLHYHQQSSERRQAIHNVDRYIVNEATDSNCDVCNFCDIINI